MKNIKLLTAIFGLLFVAQFTYAQSALNNGRQVDSAPTAQAVEENTTSANTDVLRSGTYPGDWDINGEDQTVKEDTYYPVDVEIMQEEIMASAHPSVVAEKINTLSTTIDDLRRLCEELRLENQVIRASLGNCCSNSELGLTARDAYLVQNAPNPFSEAAEINYFIPEGLNNVEVRICNFKGEVLNATAIQDAGYGKLKVDAAGLNAGSFVYLLAVDGEVIDSKVMVITK